MTTLTDHDPAGDQQLLPAELRATIADNAKSVDKAELDARYILPLLGEAGLLGGPLSQTAQVIREISTADLSAGFTVWAQSMTLEYLRFAGTEFAAPLVAALQSGERPGVTGMAPVLKEAAGAGEIPLIVEPVEGGYRINGKLNWASNLYDDAVLVTGAKTSDGDHLIFVVEAGHEGLNFGNPFGLLGLNATASAWVSFENLVLPEAQVLTRSLVDFVPAAKPVLALLQVSECLGVSEAAAAAAATRMSGINETFRADLEKVTAGNTELLKRQEAAIAAFGNGKLGSVELLELRLDAAELAIAATAVEVRVAGGAGYAKSSPTSRRFREAAFIPVQSPSESQLRWELARAREKVANG